MKKSQTQLKEEKEVGFFISPFRRRATKSSDTIPEAPGRGNSFLGGHAMENKMEDWRISFVNTMNSLSTAKDYLSMSAEVARKLAAENERMALLLEGGRS